jgi:hypothetical protein
MVSQGADYDLIVALQRNEWEDDGGYVSQSQQRFRVTAIAMQSGDCVHTVVPQKGEPA